MSVMLKQKSCVFIVTILFKPELMLFKNASSPKKEGWRIFPMKY